MRVKVVAPDPHDGYDVLVDMAGVIDSKLGQHDSYDWIVRFDGVRRRALFTSQELAPLDDSTSKATVIEGVVDTSGCIDWSEGATWIGDTFVGKRVRVTIEVLADSESDGDAK